MKHAGLISRNKERSRKMTGRGLVQQAFGLTLIVLLLTGCGGAPASGVVEGIQVQVLSANTGGSAPVGDDEINPDNFSGRRFLVGVMIEGGELVGSEAVWDWAIDNIRLVYDDEEYEVITVGMEFDQGSFVGDILSFTVPKDSEFARYTLQVADQVSIDLGSFFE